MTMCGRYTLARKPEEILGEVGAEIWDGVADYTPRYNIAPTLDVPVLMPGEPRALRTLRWGLVPRWATDSKRAANLINARSETIDEKPSFRQLVGQRHCVVPADGYDEWRRAGTKKTPFLVHDPSGRLLLMAGLWDDWTGPDGPLTTFTLITRPPLRSIAHIHDRMPVLLRPEQVAPWLQADATAAHAIIDAVDLPLAAYACNPLVNNARNDSPACREPVPEDGELGLW
jgi:putative SOS response-associated peptidase YedK